ncbi:MAG TPA: sulfotransferase domain-containing protein [Rhabdochlamydiaceae bacterium]|jgi:hypothetical protein
MIQLIYTSLFLLFYFSFFPLFGTNFVLFTEPKTGTHLLIPLLETLTGKKVYWAKEFASEVEHRDFLNISDFENPQFCVFSAYKAPWDWNTMEEVWRTTEKQRAFLHLHAPYSLTLEKYLIRNKCINFFVKRDPRDQIVSLLNHYKHIHLDDKALENISSDDEKLLFLIQNRLREEIIYFKGWLESPACCVLDFRNLMGSHGGAATDQDALKELRKIANALSIQVSDHYLLKIYKQHFGKGWNFFQGKVGSWKDYFKEHHKAAAKNEIGDLLIELGHEKNTEW